MAKRLTLAATALAFLLAPATSNAVTITATFEGTVTSVSDPIPVEYWIPLPPGVGPITSIEPGDPMALSFQFESDAPDTAPDDPTRGQYDSSNARMQVASYFEQAEPNDGYITVYDDDPVWRDLYDAFAQSFWPQTVEEDWIFASWGVQLSDSTATVFGEDVLPTDLSLGDFDRREFLFALVTKADGNHTTFIRGSVTSIRFVPEPAAALLLFAGLLRVRLAEGSRSPRR